MKKRPIIFLDIDGVLNDLTFLRRAQSCNINPARVAQLNRIVAKTDAQIVLSSAWRYMVHSGAMKLTGFAYMLRTHGLMGCGDRFIGLTCRDEECHDCAKRHKRGMKWDGKDFCCEVCGAKQHRGKQIRAWIRQNKERMRGCRYVVIDDGDLGIRAARLPFVQTDDKIGLTRNKADEAIRILLGKD